MPCAVITELNSYPVKSCGRVALERARIDERGFSCDREWMIIGPAGRFLTQRELPRLALIQPAVENGLLSLRAPGMDRLQVVRGEPRASLEVEVWDDVCAATDEGESASRWLSDFLGCGVRLVRFDPVTVRLSARAWTGEVESPNAFSDGFPLLIISQASLADLNARLPEPLPMNRFRPNIVLGGIGAFEEDRIADLVAGWIRLRIVKPCTRCAITTVEQSSGEFKGAEPLKTLRTYRWDPQLRGVRFGQNAIIVSGVGLELQVGQAMSFEYA